MLLNFLPFVPCSAINPFKWQVRKSTFHGKILRIDSKKFFRGKIRRSLQKIQKIKKPQQLKSHAKNVRSIRQWLLKDLEKRWSTIRVVEKSCKKLEKLFFLTLVLLSWCFVLIFAGNKPRFCFVKWAGDLLHGATARIPPSPYHSDY